MASEAEATGIDLDALLEAVSLDTPNCSGCLRPMETAESVSGAPFWSCPHCPTSRLA